VECNPKQGPDIMRLANQLTSVKSKSGVMYMDEAVFTEWDDLSNIAPRGY
jgi:simple sugar transport system substrate-binding protein